MHDAAKLAVKQGRKAAGLFEIAGLPWAESFGLFVHRKNWQMKKNLLAGLAVGVMAFGMAGAASATAIAGGQLYSTGGDINVTVEPSSAGYTHDLWLYSPTAQYIAKNYQFGTTVNLGSFSAGDELIFGIYVNNTGYTFKTGPGSRNADGLAHALAGC